MHTFQLRYTFWKVHPSLVNYIILRHLILLQSNLISLHKKKTFCLKSTHTLTKTFNVVIGIILSYSYKRVFFFFSIFFSSGSGFDIGPAMCFAVTIPNRALHSFVGFLESETPKYLFVHKTMLIKSNYSYNFQ